MTMTSRERIEAAIRGERPDRTPIALWRHFPVVDETAEGLAKAHIDFQTSYEFDLLKVTPASGYPAEAWGAELINNQNNEEGTREYSKRVVNRPEDWRALHPLDVLQGVWARELKALKLIREGLGDDLHILQTIFSPLTIAKQLAGEGFLDHMRTEPEHFKTGMRIVCETSARFALECLNHGADGIFFASQFASEEKVTSEEYREFGVEFDLPILEAIQSASKLNMLHLHGNKPFFGLAGLYPVHIVNWHDRETQPTLREGHKLFTKGAVLGGINRTTFPSLSTDEVKSEVTDAISQADNNRLIVGAGCVTYVTTPDENIRAAIDVCRRESQNS